MKLQDRVTELNKQLDERETKLRVERQEVQELQAANAHLRKEVAAVKLLAVDPPPAGGKR